jgi:hypothetical protein
MKSNETRMLRFLHAAGDQDSWVSYQIILKTDDLLPGDERALPTLMWRGLIEENAGKGAYRLSEAGRRALRDRRDAA